VNDAFGKSRHLVVWRSRSKTATDAHN